MKPKRNARDCPASCCSTPARLSPSESLQNGGAVGASQGTPRSGWSVPVKPKRNARDCPASCCSTPARLSPSESLQNGGAVGASQGSLPRGETPGKRRSGRGIAGEPAARRNPRYSNTGVQFSIFKEEALCRVQRSLMGWNVSAER